MPRQFDLLCEGKAGNGKDVKPFTRRLHVDLDQRLFCLDGCWHLTEVSESHLAYHYDLWTADRDHPARAYRRIFGSTAGPFEQREDVTVDLRTGAFKRLYVYDYGDIVSTRHTLDYTGRCRIVPVAKSPS